jgi:quercetin dioxygenase-like cupin family protein
MLLNADLSRPAAVDSETLDWIASPMAGVERRMLERDGDEVARATSLVRYAPGSSFTPHTHGAGEEFLVLDGVFSDETGDFAAGAYVRNPPGSWHTPSTGPGSTILVKLRQMPPEETVAVRLDTRNPALWRDLGQGRQESRAVRCAMGACGDAAHCTWPCRRRRDLATGRGILRGRGRCVDRWRHTPRGSLGTPPAREQLSAGKPERRPALPQSRASRLTQFFSWSNSATGRPASQRRISLRPLRSPSDAACLPGMMLRAERPVAAPQLRLGLDLFTGSSLNRSIG